MDKFEENLRKAKEDLMPTPDFVENVMDQVYRSSVTPSLRVASKPRKLGLSLSFGLAILLAMVLGVGTGIQRTQSPSTVASNIDAQTAQIEQELSHEGSTGDLAVGQLDNFDFTN